VRKAKVTILASFLRDASADIRARRGASRADAALLRYVTPSRSGRVM